MLVPSIWLLLFCFQLVESLDISKCEILDMAHTLAGDNPYYPVYSPVNFTITYTGPLGKGGPYASWGYFCSFEHMATHIDAPSHFVKGGKTMEEVSFDNLVGEACVIDVTEKARIDSSYELSVQDIKDFESKHGIIPSNAILLMATGWDSYFSDAKSFFGTKNISDSATFKFPSFGPDVGEWLVKNRRIRAYGVDVISFDAPRATSFPNHVALLGAGIPGMENLKNVVKLPPRGATVFLPAIKIKGGTGGWVRAFAVGWNGDDDPCRIHNGAGDDPCRIHNGAGNALLIRNGVRIGLGLVIVALRRVIIEFS